MKTILNVLWFVRFVAFVAALVLFYAILFQVWGWTP
jgi:YbbR domain-containing protein